MVARSKLNSLENILYKAIIDNEVSHKEVATILKEAENYHKSKESIRMMKSQRSNTEIYKLMKDGIKWELMKLWNKMKELITIFQNIFVHI